MIQVSEIQSTDWSVKLGSYGDVVTHIDDIAQCIANILLTPKGSDPLRPEFGSDIWRYVDYPIDRAIPHIVRETWDSLQTWEPRLLLLAVDSSLAPELGHLIVQINWQLATGANIQTTEVAF